MTAKSIGAWLRKALSIQVLAAFILGLVIGLVVLGWNVWPVKWTDADPSDLRASQQDAYLQLIAESYALTGNADFARERLSALKKPAQTDADLSTMIEASAQTRSQAGKAEDAIRLQRLVTALGLPPAGTVVPPTAQPTSQPKPQPTTQPTSGGSKALLRVLGTTFFLILLAGGVMVLFTQLQKREPRRPRPITPAPEPSPDREEEPAVEAASGVGPSANHFVAEYHSGDDAYDVSFSIELAGEFVGECGIAALTRAIGEPGHFKAFDIWMFDKLATESQTKLLLSEGAANDPVLSVRLPERGEPVQARLDRVLTLESENLRLVATIVDLDYEDSSNMVFSKLVAKLDVFPKTPPA